MLKNLQFSKDIKLLFLSILLFATAVGINLVTFPTLLSTNGINSFQIGIASTFEIFGGIAASFLLSKLVAKFGIQKSLKIAASCYSLGILLIYFYQGFFLWLAFIFFMGFCWFLYVITRQSWFNILLSDEQRGVATGIFSMTISAGIALGPVIVKLTGARDYGSFIVSAILVLSSYLCISKIKNADSIDLSAKRIPLIDFFKNNPRCFVARFFLDFQSYMLLVFSVVYGVKIGLSYEAAGLLITAFMVSGFFDVWVGFALKKFSPYKMINIGFLLTIYAFIVVILYHESYKILLALYFIFGLGIACIYVSTFKIANEDYDKEKLVAANSTFQIIGSLGSLCGGLMGGLFLNVFDAQGFPLAMILVSTFYLTFLVIYEKKFSKR
jgi:MFS family permease